MKRVSSVLAFSVTVLSTCGLLASEYTCKGNRVEKGGSTKYTLRTYGSDVCVEKSGSTKGCAKQRGSAYYVEVSGSTKAKIENGRIYKSGLTWIRISEVKKTYDCPDIPAATLWVLDQLGYLR